MSVAWEEKEKDKLVVIGDGVDAVTLTSRLRKKIGHAELISVGEVKEEKKENEETKEKKDPEASSCQFQWYPFVYDHNYRILY